MTDIQIGDHVRVIRDTPYGAREGEEFTVTHISPPLKPEGAYAIGKGYPGGVWLTDLELADRAGERVERHIAHINGLHAVIRKRNATIERLQAQLAEYAAQLDDTHTLDKTAYQLGLSSDNAVHALEIGARLLAHGFTGDDIDAAVKNFLGGEHRVLRDLQKRIGEANAAKGFHEEGDYYREAARERRGLHAGASLRNYTVARLALITTEVAEAIEEVRAGHAVDETYYPSETKGLSVPELRKPEGVPSEVADVVIRAFDFAHEFGIDLAAMIEEKLAYNATRAHKHGKVM